MTNKYQAQWFCFSIITLVLFSSVTDGKGFGGGRGGGFKGGSRGGGIFSGSKGPGTFGGSSSYNNIKKPSSGSSFRKNAMSFGAGALGGIAAYSVMSSIAHSYRGNPGYYPPGYGTGETCVNNDEFNNTRFGIFRCPLSGFKMEDKYCCGESGKQYCCGSEYESRGLRGRSHFGWIVLIIIIITIATLVLLKRHRKSQNNVILVPKEMPVDEQAGAQFCQPPPPPPQMGYPTGSYGPNQYSVPPQNYPENFNPYLQPNNTPYPPVQQAYNNPYPPVQQAYNTPYPPAQQAYNASYPPAQQAYNPYQSQEANLPSYDDAIRSNQGLPSTKAV